FWGAVICLLGAALGAYIILIFVRKFGYKVVELFVSREKINEIRFLNNDQKLAAAVFILYIIPGTPKDPLIFFFGLTRIKIIDFIVISTIARIPSVVSSTVGGDFIVAGNYKAAIILFAITAAVSIAGMIIYRVVLKRVKAGKGGKEV
ncbi:MAG: VTT domain-containing protein, partial [Clostridiales bacterium]|nr:VTT domain-containing protein [Candidatus Coliplasma equi]